MISRYARSAMQHIWQDQSKFNAFLDIELAALEAWVYLDVIPKKDFESIKAQATFQVEDIYEIEAETRHDVIAFIEAVSMHLGPEKKWFHYGLTSTDIVDSGLSLLIRDANQIIEQDILDMLETLKSLARTYKHVISMGRTHGMHAEPTSFGLKFLLWYNDFKRLLKDFIYVRKDIEVIKLSGAVGNFAANTPKLQDYVCQKLNMDGVKISTQTLQRDRHAKYISILALIGSQLDKMAVEIRHLSRTEVKEVSEPFAAKQKGSSAMPHKRNPVTSENISGLSRVLRGYVTTAFENISLWHERDISHSSAERIILADATMLVDYMLHRFNHMLKNLVVFESQIAYNLTRSYGVIYSQKVLSQLIKKGLDRTKAYELIQSHSLKAMDEKMQLKDLLLKDPTVKSILSDEEISQLFLADDYLRYVDEIYQNVLEEV